MRYNIDFNKLIVLLLPTFLRNPRIIGFLRAAVNPLSKLYDDFNKYRTEDHKRLDHNWQKCYFEKRLNDIYDSTERKIKIIEGEKYSREYIYTHGERKPINLGIIYIRSSNDFADTGSDFTIDMNKVEANEDDLNAQINFYKLAGTRYNIINLPKRFQLTDNIQRI